MLRDIEAGGRIEAGQIIGDMIVRSGTRPPILSLVHAHLRAYEIRRAREGGR
jgi:2-dehydropantoate 2-reductase